MASVQLCGMGLLWALGRGCRGWGSEANSHIFLVRCCVLVLYLPGPENFTPRNEMLKCWQKVPPVTEFKNLSLFKQAG